MSVERFANASLASIPLAAWVMPLVAPWGLLLPISTALLAYLIWVNKKHSLTLLALITATLLAILFNILPLALGSSLIAVAVLVKAGSRYLNVAAAGMFLHTSAATNLLAFVSQWLASISLEAAGPALVGATIFTLTTWRRPLLNLSLISLILALAWLGNVIELMPDLAMALASAPLILVLIFANLRGLPFSPATVLVISFLALATWIATPPKKTGELYVALPQPSDAYEAMFFDQYSEALTIAGIDATVTSDLAQIPPRATVLIPWLTTPLLLNESNELGEEELGSRARELGWTVIFAGEHDGYGDNDTRAESIAGRKVFDRNLTVPPRNTDTSGPLRSPSIFPWPNDAILNRGASAIPPGISGRVLLTGDGWWTEPYRNDPTWTGDYVWREDDSGGRISLAVAHTDGAAIWVGVGDSSPFLNQQIIADARPLTWLISAASLYPLLAGDLLVLSIIFLLLFVNCKRPKPENYFWPKVGVAVSLVTIATLNLLAKPQPDPLHPGLILGESGFDERNFNVALANKPDLALSGWDLHRKERPITARYLSNNKYEVLFTHIHSEAVFGEVTLNNCWRLGALQVADGPYLMDAQACQVTGEVDILAGTREAAAILTIDQGESKLILVLDTAFLSAGAPQNNQDWLLETMSEFRQAPKQYMQ